MGLNRLDGKVAIVTGATRGIGRAIAIGYGREGAKVVITGTKAHLCDDVADIIKGEGGEALAVPCDISNTEDIDNLYEKTLEKYGRVDIAVNNAGVTLFKEFLEMDPESMNCVCKVNLFGTYFCAQRAARQMVKQGGGGKIINMSSVIAETGQTMLSAYATTKAAITIMTKCVALELAPYRINVNAIGAGTIITDMNRDKRDLIERDSHLIPLGVGQPEDLVGISVFLATEESSYMTGHTIFVDGGYNIK